MTDTPPPIRHVVGCMTGTSLDGLDAALTRITGTGLGMTAEFLGMVSAPLPDTLRTTLLAMANGQPHPPIEFMRAARHLGVVHAEACAELLHTHASNLKPHAVDFVVAHGQTIWHAPADRLSWQLFDPWPIVRTLNLPVCYDLRQADLVAGGEGAPITPIADWVMYRDEVETRTVVNLGGVINITQLPIRGSVNRIEARDVGPGNLLIDGMTRRRFPERRYDEDGTIAGAGTHRGVIYAELGREPLKGRTGGREQYSDSWVASVDRRACSDLTDTEAVSAAVEAVAMWIADALAGCISSHIIVAGGGVKNLTLVNRIRARLEAGVSLSLSDDLGIPCEAREAMGFAVLGALSADGVPITLPQVTGGETPGVAGVWARPT